MHPIPSSTQILELLKADKKSFEQEEEKLRLMEKNKMAAREQLLKIQLMLGAKYAKVNG